jgi:hypothetical protein
MQGLMASEGIGAQMGVPKGGCRMGSSSGNFLADPWQISGSVSRYPRILALQKIS